MALVVVDDKSIVKIKTRNILLTKTCEQLKLKGLDAAAAEERARAMELRLYRGSSGSESYKHDALTLFKALKSRTLEQLDEAEAEETRRAEVEKRLRQEEEESTKIPPAKKQKLEELDAELAAKAKAEGLPEGYVTGYPLRDKVRAKITAGLKLVPERERQTAVRGKIVEEEVAAAVEQEMYTQLTDLKAYKTLARDIFANISAPDNSTFRRRVLTGEIGPSKFARLKPDDMASKELRAANEALDKDSLYHSMVAENEPVEGIFQCPKQLCKSTKVRFVQVQTRSGDEPMTTFCTCVNCEFRWKF